MTMTIAELIEQLKRYDPNWLVVVAGYHHGYNHVSKINAIALQLNTNQTWDSGAHSLANLNNREATPALFLGGYNDNIPYDLDDYAS